MKTKDATAGYRVYNADALRALSLENVNSHGYCFQIDMTLRVDTAGASAVRRIDIPYLDEAIARPLHARLVAQAAETEFRW